MFQNLHSGKNVLELSASSQAVVYNINYTLKCMPWMCSHTHAMLQVSITAFCRNSKRSLVNLLQALSHVSSTEQQHSWEAVALPEHNARALSLTGAQANLHCNSKDDLLLITGLLV